ncbi:MAG: tetratricopeptide repeat protein [Acidobacteria bacterium]|nr:tetratricopeptide repeat protein [Acidobacteriota bacterium]
MGRDKQNSFQSVDVALPVEWPLRGRLVTALALAALVVGVFWNALPNGFHLDDQYHVVDNPGIQQVWPPWRHFVNPRTISTLDRIVQYRPLLPLSLSLSYALTGQDPAGFRAWNIALQAVAAVLVFFFLRALLAAAGWRASRTGVQADWVALAAATIFAVHPVAGVPVNYICARDLMLSQVFLVASLLVYLRMRARGETTWRWAVALCFFALALLSKTHVAVAPALVLALEWTVLGERMTAWRPWGRAALYGAVVAAFFAWTRFGLQFSDWSQAMAGPSGAAATYALTQLRLHLLHYLPNFLWPFAIRLAPEVSRATGWMDGAVWAGLVLVIGSVTLAFAWRRRAPAAAAVVLGYWILQVPESSVFPLHLMVSDYRPYAGSPFLFLLAAMALAACLRRPWWHLATAVLVLYFSLASVVLNRVWRTGETLWTHSVTYGGDALAHHNLAMSIANRDDPRVRRHLEEAIRRSPNFVLAHLNLGLWLIQHGQVEAGLAECERARLLEPDWAQTYYWLARAHGRLGRRVEAAAASARAATLDSDNRMYLKQAAYDAQAAGDFDGSLVFVGRLKALGMEDPETLFLEGFARQQTGDLPRAVMAYRAYLLQDPRHAQVLFNLAYALMNLGNFPEAIIRFEEVLKLKPEYREVHFHLAACYEKLNRPELAVRERALFAGHPANPKDAK